MTIDTYQHLLKSSFNARFVKPFRGNFRSLLSSKGSTKYLFFGKSFKKTTKYFLKFLFFYLKVQSFRLITENNFIQMAASAGLAVVYRIGPIFKHIIDNRFKECREDVNDDACPDRSNTLTTDENIEAVKKVTIREVC